MIKYPLKAKTQELMILNNYVSNGQMAISKSIINNIGNVHLKGNLRNGNALTLTKEQISNMEDILSNKVNQAIYQCRILWAICFNLDNDVQAYPILIGDGQIALINTSMLNLIKDLSFKVYAKNNEDAIVFKSEQNVLAIIMPMRFNSQKMLNNVNDIKKALDHTLNLINQ